MTPPAGDDERRPYKNKAAQAGRRKNHRGIKPLLQFKASLDHVGHEGALLNQLLVSRGDLCICEVIHRELVMTS